MEKKKFSVSFQAMTLFIGMAPMLLSVIILTAILVGDLENEVKDGVKGELRVAAEQVKEYFIFDINDSGDVDYDTYADHEYVESLKKEDIELTLFKGDTRFITSLKNSSGGYNEGTQASAEIFAQVKAGNEYSAENVDINGTKYFVYYLPIIDKSGNFWGMAFAGEPETDVNKTIRSIVVKVLIVAVVLVLILAAIILLGARVLAKTIVEVVGGVTRMADGNLDAEFEQSSFVKEFVSLMDAGRGLQNQLLTSVGGAKSTSTNLSEAVATVDGLSASSADGTSQIAQAVNELAVTAQSMAETVQDANATVIDMGDSIDRITTNVNDMNRSSEASMAANETAMEYMDKLTKASERSARTVDEISASIAECSKSAEKIKTATVAITDIASETNLLSLNASIEAARAGESGRGFAVVAGEIQKLAEQSSDSANEIQDVIREILARVNECVSKAEEMTDVIKEQMDFLVETRSKIDDMSTTGEELAQGAAAIDNEAKSLLVLKDNVLSAISDLSAISEENAASSEEVTASVDNIASAVESTKMESEAMRHLAEDLSEKMEFFKI